MRIPNVCRIARVALATEQFVYHVSWYCDGIARATKLRSNSYIMHFAINYLHGENMRLRDRTAKKNIKHGVVFAAKFGDFVENRLEKAIVQRNHLAEELPENPEKLKWYRVSLENGISGDGSEYYI